jgi:GT2 family glycosyltransferase
MSLKMLLAESLTGFRQAIRSLNRRRLRRRRASKQAMYAEWIACHDTLDAAVQERLAQRMAAIADPPRLSILVHTAPSAETEASLQRQIYPHWQLCTSERDGGVAASLNDALAQATGEWALVLGERDVLAPHALLFVAEAIRRFKRAQLVYCDEDSIDASGQRHTPCFKPDWNHDLILSQNFVGRLAAFDIALMRSLGGFRVEREGAHEHDLVLRCAERVGPGRIVHIPHVLVHGHGEAAAQDNEAGRQVVQDHLDRRGVLASASVVGPGRYRVAYELPDPPPSVSIIIPTKNQFGLLRTCIESVTSLTDYPSYELVVVDNGSDDPRVLKYLQFLGSRERIRVLHDPLVPFNYSALNNRAIKTTRGEFLVLMNNDIEVIEPGWLREMISHALRPEVGTVGAKLLYGDRTVQHAGVITGIGRGGEGVASHAHKGLPQDHIGFCGRACAVQSFSAVTAACLAVRRRLYMKLGGLDEKNLAVAYNDVDFCLRVREAGLLTVWTPHATLLHHESVSRGRDAAAHNVERFTKEAAYMRERWGPVLDHDPAYNPNLNQQTADFALAATPRVSLATPWFAGRDRL